MAKNHIKKSSNWVTKKCKFKQGIIFLPIKLENTTFQLIKSLLANEWCYDSVSWYNLPGEQYVSVIFKMSTLTFTKN